MTDKVSHEEARAALLSMGAGGPAFNEATVRLSYYITQQHASESASSDTVSRAEHEAALAGKDSLYRATVDACDRLLTNQREVLQKKYDQLAQLEAKLTEQQAEHDRVVGGLRQELVVRQSELVEIEAHLRKMALCTFGEEHKSYSSALERLTEIRMQPEPRKNSDIIREEVRRLLKLCGVTNWNGPLIDELVELLTVAPASSPAAAEAEHERVVGLLNRIHAMARTTATVDGLPMRVSELFYCCEELREERDRLKKRVEKLEQAIVDVASERATDPAHADCLRKLEMVLSNSSPSPQVAQASVARLVPEAHVPHPDACYCSDFQSAGLPCLPGKCPNVPK